MVKTFRVLMANQPKLMRELLVEMLEEESWIQIVGEVTDQAEIRELVLKTTPDLLVVTAEKPGKRPAICDELLREFPSLRIIAVAAQRAIPFAIGLLWTSTLTTLNRQNKGF